jgi:hypothetical protein
MLLAKVDVMTFAAAEASRATKFIAGKRVVAVGAMFHVLVSRNFTLPAYPSILKETQKKSSLKFG